MNTVSQTPKHNWYIFILFIVMCILIWSMTSCGVLKNHYLQKYCQSKDSVSEHTEIVYKDTLIFITSPKETITVNNPCDTVIHIYKKQNGLKMAVNSVKGKLTFTCEADSLKAVIKTLQSTKSKFKLVTQQVKVNELTKIQGFWIITGQWLLGLLIAYILFRVFKGYLKSYIPFIK